MRNAGDRSLLNVNEDFEQEHNTEITLFDSNEFEMHFIVDSL
jgi:hypothetical protein